MEFIGLTSQQQALLRQWVEQVKTEPGQAQVSTEPQQQIAAKGPERPDPPTKNPTPKPPIPRADRRTPAWILILVLAAALLAIFWWHWNRGWQELESGLPDRASATVEHPQVTVPAEVMEKLVVHRVDPEYPNAARQAKMEGVVVLDVIVGRDGSVVSMHPVNGEDVFTRAAMDALRWWRFEPYRIDGKPVAVETTVAVEFHP
jgi:TonB family protein